MIPELNGVLFYEQSPSALMAALDDFESKNWNPVAIRRHAQRYDIKVFQDRLLNFLSEVSPAMREQDLLQRRAG